MARRSRLAFSLSAAVLPIVFGLAAADGETGVPPVAYRAEVIVVANGVTTRSLIVSDGVRRKSEAPAPNGGASGTDAANEKKLSWLRGAGFRCLPMPPHPAGEPS